MTSVPFFTEEEEDLVLAPPLRVLSATAFFPSAVSEAEENVEEEATCAAPEVSVVIVFSSKRFVPLLPRAVDGGKEDGAPMPEARFIVACKHKLRGVKREVRARKRRRERQTNNHKQSQTGPPQLHSGRVRRKMPTSATHCTHGSRLRRSDRPAKQDRIHSLLPIHSKPERFTHRASL